MNLLETCETCYPYSLSEYPTDIVINGEITEPLYYKITDKFQNSFTTEELITPVDGSVTLQIEQVCYNPSDFEDLPEAWLNKSAGRFYIEASLDKQNWQPVNFTFGGLEYGCIVVTFYFDNSDKNTIE